MLSLGTLANFKIVCFNLCKIFARFFNIKVSRLLRQVLRISFSHFIFIKNSLTIEGYIHRIDLSQKTYSSSRNQQISPNNRQIENNCQLPPDFGLKCQYQVWTQVDKEPRNMQVQERSPYYDVAYSLQSLFEDPNLNLQTISLYSLFELLYEGIKKSPTLREGNYKLSGIQSSPLYERIIRYLLEIFPQPRRLALKGNDISSSMIKTILSKYSKGLQWFSLVSFEAIPIERWLKEIPLHPWENLKELLLLSVEMTNNKFKVIVNTEMPQLKVFRLANLSLTTDFLKLLRKRRSDMKHLSIREMPSINLEQMGKMAAQCMRFGTQHVDLKFNVDDSFDYFHYSRVAKMEWGTPKLKTKLKTPKLGYLSVWVANRNALTFNSFITPKSTINNLMKGYILTAQTSAQLFYLCQVL